MKFKKIYIITAETIDPKLFLGGISTFLESFLKTVPSDIPINFVVPKPPSINEKEYKYFGKYALIFIPIPNSFQNIKPIPKASKEFNEGLIKRFRNEKKCLFIFNDYFISIYLRYISKNNKIVYIAHNILLKKYYMVSKFYKFYYIYKTTLNPIKRFFLKTLYKYFNTYNKLLQNLNLFYNLNNFFYYLESEQVAIDCSDLVVCPSKGMENFIRKYFSPKKIITLTWPFDLEYNIKIVKKHAKHLRKKLNLQKKTKIILYLGRNDPQKGFDILLKALDILKKEICLIVVGNHNHKYYNLLYKMPHVIFKKIKYIFGEEKFALYQLSDIFVSPAVFEPFGYTYLEADCFAKNMVCFATDGINEMCPKDKSNVIDLDGNLPKKLASKLKYLIDSNISKKNLINKKKYIKSNIFCNIINNLK